MFADDRRVWQIINVAAAFLKALGKSLWLSWLQLTRGGCSMSAILDGAKYSTGGGFLGAEPVKYTCAQQRIVWTLF